VKSATWLTVVPPVAPNYRSASPVEETGIAAMEAEIDRVVYDL